MNRHAAFALAAALAVSGCSTVDVATQPGEMTGDVPCPEEQVENGVRVLACAEAVRAAERALGAVHAPILSAEFARGVGNCPKMPSGASAGEMGVSSGPGAPVVPGLRCSRITRNTSGTVVFTFWVGDPVRMYVALDEHGVAVASSDFMDVEADEVPPAGAPDDPLN